MKPRQIDLKNFIGLLLLGVFALSGCTSKVDPQPSCNFVQNGSLQRVSWKEATPVSIYVHDSFPQEYIPVLQSAMQDWEKVIGKPLFRIGGSASGVATPTQDGVSEIYWLSDWEPDRSFEQARTTIYWEGNHISEADVRVNVKDFQYFTGSDADANKVDLESLLVHELGHVLGLQHNTAPGSVMAVNLADATFRRIPQQVDIDSVKCEY